MKTRINGSLIGITLAAMGLTIGCGDDTSEAEGGDAGLGSDTSTTGTNTGSTTTQTLATSDDETSRTTDSDDETCEGDVSIVCEGDNRVRLDPCGANEREELEQCAGACDQGRCVDCAPRGVVCNDGDVYLIDSCDQIGDVVADCENGCSLGECVAAECVPSDEKQCVGNLLFAVNSCGDQTNIEDVCDDGCVDGACMGCVDEGETLCYEGNIYPVDSCGRTGAVLEECATSCTVSSTGNTTTATCSDALCDATTNVECFKGDMYAVDSCGGITEELVTDCHNGCDEGGCLPCVPAPDGVTCFGGNVYDTIGGCDAPSVRDETVKEVCAFGCLNGACTEEGECVPVGTVCLEGNVHNIDSCQEVGDLVETCTTGCQNGACTDGSDGGVDSSGSGTSGSGTSSSGASSSGTGDNTGTVESSEPPQTDVDAGASDSIASSDTPDAGADIDASM